MNDQKTYRYAVYEVGFIRGQYDDLEQAKMRAMQCYELAQVYDRETGEIVYSSRNHGVSG